VIERAIELSTVDFGVTCGLRTVEEQKDLYASGRTKPGPILTKTMNSRHLSGKAVDLVAIVAGEAKWDMGLYEKINKAVQKASNELGIPVVWGGDWNGNGSTLDERFIDGVHWELDKQVYD
jgi:peptidoglycan L-alanyl-D-glutamate endopeptidase CwlK